MKSPTQTQVRAAWKKAGCDTRKTLEDLFGCSVKGDITDQIKLPIDAFRLLDAPQPPSLNNPGSFQDGITAFHKLQVITAALNEGWVPDWNDEDQPKYSPFFAFQGGRFVFGAVLCFYSNSYLGSRLCFKSRELAEYAGQQFEDLYNDFLTL